MKSVQITKKFVIQAETTDKETIVKMAPSNTYLFMGDLGFRTVAKTSPVQARFLSDLIKYNDSLGKKMKAYIEACNQVEATGDIDVAKARAVFAEQSASLSKVFQHRAERLGQATVATN